MSEISSVYLERMPDVFRRTGDPRATWYRKSKLGLVTPPIKLSERSSAVPSNETDAIIAARVAGKSQEEIRSLVKRLIAERAERFARIAAHTGTAAANTAKADANSKPPAAAA